LYFWVLVHTDDTVKKYPFLILFSVPLFFLLTGTPAARGESPGGIRSGFYLKLGPVFPVGQFARGQSVPFEVGSPPEPWTLDYLPAKTGFGMDIGYLIYLGPQFAKGYLRAGIDAAFLSLWFNSVNPPVKEDRAQKYYSFAGQKFGPVITVNPVEKLMIDLSYKLNANISYHDELDGWAPLSDAETSEYGVNLVFQEVSMSVRYRIMVFSFQYNFGTMNYNNVNKDRQDQKIRENTFRIMFGLKF